MRCSRDHLHYMCLLFCLFPHLKVSRNFVKEVSIRINICSSKENFFGKSNNNGLSYENFSKNCCTCCFRSAVDSEVIVSVITMPQTPLVVRKMSRFRLRVQTFAAWQKGSEREK